MAKKVLSIEVGAWWTKVALMEPNKKSASVQDLFYFATPDKSVEDGYIRDRDRFLGALRDELTKRRIVERDVIFNISSTKVVTREASIPAVKDKKLAAVVETQAKEHFPMDISSYTISYKKMEEFTDEGGKKVKLLLIAMPDNLLNNYVALAKSGDFNIVSFEYIGNAILSFANNHFNVDSVVVQLEENQTILSIIAGKKLVFQRVAPNGYATTLRTVLDHAVLGIEDEMEAFEFLANHNVLYKKPKLTSIATEEDQRRQMELEDAYNDIRDSLSYHIRVVGTALEYYRNQSKKDFHGVLRLIGDGARISGIKKLFEDSIPLELSVEEPIYLVHLAKTIDREKIEEVDYVSVLGAPLAPLGIKPKEMLAQESKRSTLKTAYFAFAASLLISIAMVGSAYFRYYLAMEEHDTLTRRIQQLSYVQIIYDENTAAVAEAAQYDAFDAMTWTYNEYLADLIAGLEEQLPSTTVVESMTVSGRSITMNLTSPDKLTTAQLLLNLYEIPVLGNVAIPSMSENEDDMGNSIWQYSVTATYVDPPAEEPAAVETTETAETNETEGTVE